MALPDSTTQDPATYKANIDATAADHDANLIGMMTRGIYTSASGATIDFTGLPSWIKKITIMLESVSVSASSSMYLKIGDSGGVESSGYETCFWQIDATPVGSNNISTNYWWVSSPDAGSVLNGHITVTNISGNIWIQSGTLTDAGVGKGYICGGSKTLTGTLDRLQFSLNAGTFDAGQVNILYEG